MLEYVLSEDVVKISKKSQCAEGSQMITGTVNTENRSFQKT